MSELARKDIESSVCIWLSGLQEECRERLRDLEHRTSSPQAHESRQSSCQKHPESCLHRLVSPAVGTEQSMKVSL